MVPVSYIKKATREDIDFVFDEGWTEPTVEASIPGLLPNVLISKLDPTSATGRQQETNAPNSSK